MVQDAAKSFEARLPFPNMPKMAAADVLVAIYARGERRLGVVHVQHRDAREAHGAVERGNRLRETSFGVNLVAGVERVRGIEANA